VDFTASLSDTVSFNFAADGAGGVVVAYIDSGAVRVVRVTGDGTMPWGEPATTLVESNVVVSQPPVVASDGAGGAFVAWVSNSPHDIHVQHVASDGTHLWPEGGAVVPDLSGTERDVALVSDGVGGIFLSFDTSSSLRGQRLDPSGAGQWRLGGSNGLSLMSGSTPIIGVGSSGPIVIYDTGFGLAVRSIDVPEPTTFELTEIGILPTGQLSFTLSGGIPDTEYDIFRSTVIGVPLTDPAWTLVGTVQPGETWTDSDPPIPTAFYVARERTP
jgi:hypothetical protein